SHVRMAGVPILLASLPVLLRAGTSWAVFHISNIDEVMSGQTIDAGATMLPPGDGTMSLQRMGDTGNDLADFALAPRTPDSNGCATTTTTLPSGGAPCADAAALASTRAQVTAQCDCAGARNHATHVKCAAAVAKTAVR